MPWAALRPGVCLLARDVAVTQPLQDAEATEEERVCLSCELSREDEEVEWSLNGTPLYNDSFHEISHEGRRHTLVLKSVRRADAGTVRASSPKVSTTACLVVRGELCLWGLRVPSVHGQVPGFPHQPHLPCSQASGVPESTRRCVRGGVWHAGPAVRSVRPRGPCGLAQRWRGTWSQQQV